MNELLLLLVLGVSIAGVVLIAMLITKERTSAREARDELNRIMSSFAGVQNAQFEALRGAVEQRLERIQQDNSAKLEQMRQTVFFQAEDGIRDLTVTGVQTCALPI